ncbi:MAG TPA: hypothetical protein PKJ41_01810 [Bryobacteraceae bacterium]|nr:hypothetical protein [Bryobacteraceae bacterium]HPT25780.1 hypothetical protein [Bryobacteraceae bacterium]
MSQRLQFLGQAAERTPDIQPQVEDVAVVFDIRLLRSKSSEFLCRPGIFGVPEWHESWSSPGARSQGACMVSNHAVYKLPPIPTRRIEVWEAPQAVQGQVLSQVLPIVGGEAEARLEEAGTEPGLSEKEGREVFRGYG